MKKTMRIALLALLPAVVLALTAGCGGVGAGGAFDAQSEIAVVSREDGSGTRGAFAALFGVEAKGGGGSKKDRTTKEAVIAKQTDVMMAIVGGDKYAIGYISLGSMNDMIKAVSIDGVAPGAAQVKDGSYAVSRPFHIATKGAPSGPVQDFIAFVLSAEGQGVVAENYVAIKDSAPAYAGGKPAGKIVVAGSSSVSPVMEKLKEAYREINPNATIEIQQSDSSAGITGAIDGTCDIAMSSRDLTDGERTKLTQTQIAIDGIAVVVNKSNPVTDLTKDQVKSIYTGAVTKWSDVAG
ncbi:MAG: substrate-binding domain-containing protein [Clostridiales Family XIII bacterium]|jgi:phosphate transport system substrate-binding protein|nr:substrate-binding domain-containing protein [Clostridiales Family XIII bacterium]